MQLTRICRIGQDNCAIRFSSCNILPFPVNPRDARHHTPSTLPRESTVRIKNTRPCHGTVTLAPVDGEVYVGGLHVLRSDGGYVRVAITVDDREEAEAMLDAGERGVMV